MIIGAPVYSTFNTNYQNGVVYIVLSKNGAQLPLHNINLDQNADIVIHPPSDAISSRFGHSITVLDINLDGFEDLVISAPSYDLVNIKYEVLLIFNKCGLSNN